MKRTRRRGGGSYAAGRECGAAGREADDPQGGGGLAGRRGAGRHGHRVRRRERFGERNGDRSVTPGGVPRTGRNVHQQDHRGSSRRSIRRSRSRPTSSRTPTSGRSSTPRPPEGIHRTVFQNAIGFLRKYDAKNVLLDLGEQVKAETSPWTASARAWRSSARSTENSSACPVGSNSMALVIDKPVYTRAGVTPEQGWTWDDFDEAMTKVRDKTGRAGDSGMYGVMYLYDLYLRQNGKAFFTEDGLGFTEADLTTWWTKTEKGVKSGSVRRPPRRSRTGSPSRRSPRNSPAVSSPGTTSPSATPPKARRVRPRADPHHGRQADRPVPRLADAQRLQAHRAPQGGRPVHRLHGPRPRGRQDHGLRPRCPHHTGPVRRVPADRSGQQGHRRLRGVARRGRCPGADHPAPHGADICEAAFLRIAEEVALGSRSVEDAVEQFFTESKAALAADGERRDTRCRAGGPDGLRAAPRSEKSPRPPGRSGSAAGRTWPDTSSCPPGSPGSCC